jgi:hypothetical protein
MTTRIDFRKLLDEALQKFAVLFKQRGEIDAELLKLRQFIYATTNMLPEEEKGTFQAGLAELAAQMGGPTEAVREILKFAAQEQTYFAATEVRDHLVKSGFDFSSYNSNPLASVNTILRRFKPGEVETTQRDGAKAYRWILCFPRVRAEEGRRGKVATGRLKPGARR